MGLRILVVAVGSALLCMAGCGGSASTGPTNSPPVQPAPAPGGADGTAEAGGTAGAGGTGAGATDLGGFTALVEYDEHNDRVTDAMRTGDVPVRGGVLKIRLPSFPAGMNRHIQSHNTTGRRELSWYLNIELGQLDIETLEWLPWGATYWATQDLLELKGGKRLFGRILREFADGIEFAEGGAQVTLNKFEVKRTPGEGGAETVTLDTGETFVGAVREMARYTLQVEDRSKAETIIVKHTDLVAESWEHAGAMRPGIKPNVVHTIHIRKGIRWDDGKPMTADDVVFTVNDVVMNKHVPAPHLRAYYDFVESCRASDPHTVRFIWKKPYFQSLDYSVRVRTVPKHVFWKPEYAGDPKAFGTDYAKHLANIKPVGNGPFILAEWNKLTQVMKFRRNPDFFAQKVGFPWFDTRRPFVDEVHWVVIKETNAAVKAMQAGDIDLDKDVEPNTWRRADTNAEGFTDRVARVSALAPNYTYIGWNQKLEIFRDKRVRRALTMLIPRAHILKEIHNGLGHQTTGPFFLNSPAFDPSIQPLPYDPPKARELLEAAGFADRNGDRFLDYRNAKGEVKTFEFEYLVHNARAYHRKIAVKVQESLKKAGIKVKIRMIDWTIFGKQVQERAFEAVRFAWSPQIDPDPFQIWHSSQGAKGSNYVAYANPEVDKIILEARITFDNQKRWTMLRKMHRIVNEDQPYTFMFFFLSLYFCDKDCRGVKFYKTESWRPTDVSEWWLPTAAQEARAKRR